MPSQRLPPSALPLLESVPLGRGVLGAHSLQGLGEVGAGLLVQQPRKQAEGRATPHDEAVDDVGKTLAGPLGGLEFLVGRVLERNGLAWHGDKSVYLCTY